MKINTFSSVNISVSSYAVHAISLIAGILMFASPFSPEKLMLCAMFLLMAALSLGILGYAIRNLYYRQFFQKHFIRWISLFHILLGSLLSWDAFSSDRFYMSALFLVFTLSGLSLFLSSFFLNPVGREIKNKHEPEKSEKYLSQLLANRPEELFTLVTTVITMIVIHNGVGLIRLLYPHSSLLIDGSLLLTGFSVLISLSVGSLLIYALYCGSSWARFFFYEYTILLLVLRIIFGIATVFSLMDVISIFIDMIYLIIFRHIYQDPQLKEWFRSCYLARKGQVEASN